MRLESLLAGLNSPHPAARLGAARVLGMVDETRALDAIRQRYRVETDPEVRDALAWAGKRLFEAQQAGYSSIDAICQRFGIDREIEHMEDPDEARLIERLQFDFDSEMLKRRDVSSRSGAVLGLASALASGSTMGMLQPGAAAASSNLDPSRAVVSPKRTPPTLPTNADIQRWVKRLREDPNFANRRDAAHELRVLNNPAALPPLAVACTTDPDPSVREAAQRAGQLLYLGLVYYQMDRDGALEPIIAERARAAGKLSSTESKAATEPTSAPPPAQDDINAILSKAQASRARCRKR